MNSKTVLAIGAHPDDEVLGAGGSIARHVSRGDTVHVLIVTDGASTQYDDEAMVDQKRREARQCADVLGVEAVHFGDLPDMRLDAEAHVDVNAVLEATISDIEPEVVYTHGMADVNRDHQEVFRSTMVATRPGSGVKRVLAYEVPSSTDWSGPNRSFDPNVYVDISDHLETKIAAFESYASEVRSFPHPRSERNLRALASVRGAAAGWSAAEAFMLVREHQSDRR